MEGRLRPLGSQEKRNGYALLQEKKNNYASTTLQHLVELIHRSPIISLTFKK